MKDETQFWLDYAIDSIYLSSKYPIGSALPDFYPDTDICTNCLEIAYRVKMDVKGYNKYSSPLILSAKSLFFVNIFKWCDGNRTLRII